MDNDPVSAFRAKLQEAQWDGSMACPIAVPLPKKRRLHEVPIELRAKLVCIADERRRLNARVNTDSPLYGKLPDDERRALNLRCVAPEEHYRLSSAVEVEFENIVRTLRQCAHASENAIIEIHEGWKFSATTHWHLARAYQASQRKKPRVASVEHAGKPSGPNNDCYHPSSTNEVCHLLAYYQSRALGQVTLESYLARERKVHKKPVELAAS
ncbi:MAG: hypothetical protein AAB480_00280 [Patescibacteria group bacterium]